MRWILILLVLLAGCESKVSLPFWSDIPFKLDVEGGLSLTNSTLITLNEWEGITYNDSYREILADTIDTPFVEEGSTLIMGFGEYEPISIEVTRDFNTFNVAGPHEQIEEPLVVAQDTDSFMVEFEGHSFVYYNIKVIYEEGHSINYTATLGNLSVPYDLESGKQAGDLIVKLRDVTNLDSLTNFVEGTSDIVRIVRYTIEEDEVVYELSRVNGQILMTIDSSRDELLSAINRVIKQYSVQEIKEEAGSYNAILEDGSEIELFKVN